MEIFAENFRRLFFQRKEKRRGKKTTISKRSQGREREKESILVGALGSKKDERKGTVAEGGKQRT